MAKRLIFIIPLGAFLLLLILLKSGLGKDPNLLPSMLVNKPVPTFTAPSLLSPQSQVTDLQLKGNIALVNVWASWCTACQIEHPILIDIAKDHRVLLYGLNYKDNQNSALRFLFSYGNPYQNVIFDPQGQIAMQFGVYGTPETFLIDKKGIVRYRYVGPITLDILEKDLLPQIKKIEDESK